MKCCFAEVIDKPVKKEDVHVPAVNLTELKRTDKLREKMEAIKAKRKLNQKLGYVIILQIILLHKY